MESLLTSMDSYIYTHGKEVEQGQQLEVRAESDPKSVFPLG